MTATSSLEVVSSPQSGSEPAARLITIDIPPALIDALLLGAGEVALQRAATAAWEKPASETRLIGLGAALRLQGGRDEPIATAAPVIRNHAGKARYTGQRSAKPRFFGGGRFAPGGQHRDKAWDEFGGWQFIVPELLLAFGPEGVTGSFTTIDDGSDVASLMQRQVDRLLSEDFRPKGERAPERRGGAAGASQDEWMVKVAAAVSEIAAGRYDKVVLARSAPLEASQTVDTGELLARLADRYPGCYVFKYGSGDAAWAGATPELLLSFEGGCLRTASLAGSRPRGDNPARDEALVRELLGSEKERAEHAYVAHELRQALAPFCSELRMPDAPCVVTMRNIHHLYTPIEARVRRGHDLFDLVAAVHPTSAVGGWPRDASLEAIERLEGMDRGWYAGPIGWVDFDGRGEFAVGLRSALVRGSSATLYAGAGIVAGSVPLEEYRETETKLRPLREALGA